jgi:hypothetical protein
VSAVEPHSNDDLIAQIRDAELELRDAEFPMLEVEEVTDDGETYMALRCPRCGDLIDSEELFAHGIGWTAESNEYLGDWQFDHQRVSFGEPDQPDTETLYYTHGDNPGHAVSLPEGWGADWS